MLNDRIADWLIGVRWWWDAWRNDPVRETRQWWCGKRGHGPYRVKQMPSSDMLWQSVRCRRCGKQVTFRSEPNPAWWAERQAAFRQEWEGR